MDDPKSQKDKVFFITSNPSSIDKEIEYSLSNASGMNNFNIILKKEKEYGKEKFITKACYFEITPQELKEKNKDKDSKKYKAKLLLKYDRNFEGTILFKEDRNNFIYDFKFNEFNDWSRMIPPPKYINFTKVDQLKIFNEILKYLKVKQGDKLYTNLITDSQCYITGKVFSLDFYLEVLKACYTQKEVKTLLMMFKLARVKLPKKMEVKEYSSILKIIEKKPEKIIIHCSGKDNPEKYLKSFYTILLYFRMNYEKEKVPDLLNNKNLSKYFVEILSSNYDFFSNLNVPDELIFEMMKQKNLSYKIIINSLSYISSIEKALSVINNNCEIIANCCIKEEKIIYMSELANPKQTDDLNIIITKIKKILDYESKNKKEFISFDQQFWNFYIQFNDNNLKNLLSINKALLLCQKVDKSINPDRLDIKMKIHKNGLSLIEKG
jgi:hypothetical protein